LSDTHTDAPGRADGSSGRGGGRLHRLIHGWSANLVQMLLALTQQLLLIPAFLHFWSSDRLAAWLALYAAGSLVVVADAGLQLRAVNRFLAFKSCVDCDGRTASLYARLMRIYLAIVVSLGGLLIAGTELFPPASVLGFHAVPTFDSAMLVITVGTLLALPANLVAGLYRVRGKYGRAVWSLNVALLLGQIGQLIAVAWFGSLLAVAIAYVAAQVLFALFLIVYDAPRQLPFLQRGRVAASASWRWSTGQFGLALPFAIANLTELALVNAPMLLVSAMVADRIAVAQWGLIRVISSFLRGICVQMTLPIGAELGHDYAIGDKMRLRGLYAYGSLFVTAMASAIVGGLLPFWSDFFGLWTHGSIPNDAALTVTLLIGSALVAPSLMAFVFAYHSNRGDLLARTKGLQLIAFLILSALLIPRLGPLGAAIAIVASDLLTQFGILTLVIMRQTLAHPLRHMLVLIAIMVTIIPGGWGLGLAIRAVVPGTGPLRFLAECTIWLVVVAIAASPLLMKRVRGRVLAAVPN
jgi:O-antigen/teichoic acid export membrane protein